MDEKQEQNNLKDSKDLQLEGAAMGHSSSTEQISKERALDWAASRPCRISPLILHLPALTGPWPSTLGLVTPPPPPLTRTSQGLQPMTDGAGAGRERPGLVSLTEPSPASPSRLSVLGFISKAAQCLYCWVLHLPQQLQYDKWRSGVIHQGSPDRNPFGRPAINSKAPLSGAPCFSNHDNAKDAQWKWHVQT